MEPAKVRLPVESSPKPTVPPTEIALVIVYEVESLDVKIPPFKVNEFDPIADIPLMARVPAESVMPPLRPLLLPPRSSFPFPVLANPLLPVRLELIVAVPVATAMLFAAAVAAVRLMVPPERVYPSETKEMPAPTLTVPLTVTALVVLDPPKLAGSVLSQALGMIEVSDADQLSVVL